MDKEDIIPVLLDIYDSASFKNLDEAVENLGKLHSHLHDAIVPTELEIS
jgi:hypothetical protein